MIRLTAFLLLAIVASAFVAPAYSLTPSRDQVLSGGVSESRPLTSLPAQAPAAAAADTANIFGHRVPKSAIRSDFGSINLGSLQYNGDVGRTLVLGPGDSRALAAAHVVGMGGSPVQGPFLGVAFSKSPLAQGGFTYATDMPLAFDSLSADDNNSNNPAGNGASGRLSGASIIGADRAASLYNATGKGVKVAIVDTGSDFSNPDMRDAVARDAKGIPIMLDADGQGLVLTKAKYVANIDQKTGVIMNYTTTGKNGKVQLPENVTSYTYVNDTGVYLKTSEGEIPVYNMLFPTFGAPVLSGTANVDWKIGKSSTDYIRSMSGVYHFGVVYQATMKLGTISLVLIPVLVVDSTEPGVYDTIVADMSYGWYYFTLGIAGAFPQTNYLMPAQPTFDFTDEKPFKLGDGNEFLTYDYNSDGAPDYSAGVAGARVLDIWRVTDNKTQVVVADKAGVSGVISAKLLEPMDPEGNYFGLMFDFAGHGTGTAATVASRGHTQYDIYNNSTRYTLAGMAPGATIIPVKSLWMGDALYGWLWASGFDLKDDGRWAYTGDHKADIMSNSWGISNFPLLKYGPGYDILSVFSSLLMVPHALAKDYPGTLVVDSVGNNGLGYGSVGAPNTSPLAISVGATTNNVHLQYGPFANITRFGPSTASYDDVAEFSSRGPSLLGDPKPELLAVGSYGFTPTDVTLKNLDSKQGDPNDDGAFALFGGTSMAAPMVAGAAALVVQEMKETGKAPDPFAVKSILMSTAKDLKNDPFVQGSGRVDALAAVRLARGDSGLFSVYTDDTAKTIIDSLRPSILTYAPTLGIINNGYPVQIPGTIPEIGGARETRWFAGPVEQGKKASTEIVIENPSKKEELKVELSSTIEKLVARYEVKNATKLFKMDPTHSNKTFGYEPNYYDLEKLAGGKKLPDSDLMVARVNFPFSSFMNQTERFADNLRIASVYGYDWHDANGDGKVSYSEIEMINRGGAWGTTQEMRIGDPKDKFTGTPVVGVYPVPTVFSFWSGDRLINTTSMNYTLTVELYKRMPNPDIQLGKSLVTVPPEGTAKVNATIAVRNDTLSGVYYGEIMAKGSGHNVVMPVSYIVATKPVPKDVPVVMSPPGPVQKQGANEIEGSLGLRPNGYVGGLSDMVSRYAAGDWRSYYFTVTDPTVTAMTLKVSWPHNSTSINAMAYGPDGRMVASSVPAGVFQEFANWPSNDWLGTSAVSEGGAFFFSQNAGERSTVLHVPVNATGTYSLLVHNTLFHGESLYEPLSVEAKFSTLLPDTTPPKLTAKVPEFVTGTTVMVPITIDDSNPAGLSYSVDGRPGPSSGGSQVRIEGGTLAEGPHLLTVESKDTVGNSASSSWQFTVDRTPPAAELFVRNDGSNSNNGNSTEAIAADKLVIVSKQATLAWNVTDANGVAGKVTVRMPDAKPAVYDPHSSMAFNSTALADGRYNFTISSKDVPGNKATRTWDLVVDNTPPKASVGVSGGDIRGTTKVALGVQDENLKSAMLSVGDRMQVNVTGLVEYELDTTGLPDGKYEVKLAALDMAGNEGTASTVLTVANVKPVIETVAILGLAGGLSGGAAIAWVIASRRRK
ncbi:S8 family serine peptidase [Nitrososphaera viennensis]|uniref:S8 family serine peptidase n=2 Tax=Nitrososphaera viennensis TaxID=1034015 RepID=A0A977IE44_9ARCH|nr:S8 family serine peptidase [Nitrososphaera viennensis]AIC17203.1 putative subtilase family protein [Nitrososphaera viennensis EN76]UVS69090.1 S8 family serine peptidase [Nitrososphaera viennensis]